MGSTAVVLQYFESAEDMEAGGKAFSAMDSSETPGTRASVDMCEVKLERTHLKALAASVKRPSQPTPRAQVI